MITFYGETDFVETPLGTVPREWDVVRLEGMIRTSPQYGLTTSAEEKPVGPSFLRTTDVKDGRVDWDSLPYCACSKEEFERYRLRIGDIAIARAGTVGVSVLIEEERDAIFGSYMIRVKPQPDLIHPNYLFYFLQSHIYWRQINRRGAGSTLKNINTKVLRNLLVCLPADKTEQHGITEVLSSIDEAIQKVDQIIAKTERLRTGLMQELLTRGIGPKQFTDTEIGSIPNDWEVVRLDDVGRIVNGFGFPRRYQGNKDGEYIFVKVSDTNLGGNEKHIFTTENTIDDALARKLKVKIYPAGTIVFPKIGMVIYLGKVRILSRPGTFDNNMMGIIPNEESTDTDFLYYYFLGKIDLARLAGRTTAPSIRKTRVAKLKIAVPTLQEQQAIASILLTVDKKLELERSERQKLVGIKQGLMDLLLTGKIRVKAK